MLGMAAGLGAASGLIGGIGASNAAEEQIKMMEQIAQGYGKLGQQQYDWISPWMEAGTQALTAQMQMLANPTNQQAALSGYYSSPVYAEQMEQASYATNAAAEAGGNLGTSSTTNALATQSAQLGNQYLQGATQQRNEQFKQLGGISSQGLGATKTMGNWAYQDVQGVANALSGQAAAEAGKAMAPMQGLASGISSGLGMYAMGGGFRPASQSVTPPTSTFTPNSQYSHNNSNYGLAYQPPTQGYGKI